MTVKGLARTFALAVWRLVQHDEEGVPVAIWQMECMTCHDRSDPDDNMGKQPQLWSLEHAGTAPGHRVFKLHTETYWRAEPSASNPLAKDPA
ncbi:hypothetical protein BGM19_07805 [Streptomyces agglomeratus]|uniref:DUF7848 domain-containing protein n=1 Tax=Streptomyces agglomeratus TaxID=285458 RepID=UPI0008698E5F|nr:hypothetical protein [Streptomyces agglomeratus]OEJ57883.1 hypothetical protein BGM19_07805 [Streptomyces agglomeratus]